jgi:hypothetical protein
MSIRGVEIVALVTYMIEVESVDKIRHMSTTPGGDFCGSDTFIAQGF